MTTSFDIALKQAAKSLKYLPGSEPVTYMPVSGPARKIWAVVNRIDIEPVKGIEGGNLPEIHVLVQNDTTDGIGSAELDTGGDKIETAKRVDNVPVTLRIIEILNHDAGFMLLKAS